MPPARGLGLLGCVQAVLLVVEDQDQAAVLGRDGRVVAGGDRYFVVAGVECSRS